MKLMGHSSGVVGVAAVALATVGHAEVVVTQIEARARPEMWLLNLTDAWGIANTQVSDDHDVSAVPVFDASTLSGVDVAYMSPSDGGQGELTAAEITALDAFVTGGGRMVVAADHTFWAGPWAALAAHFNVSYGPSFIKANPATVSDFRNPITNGLAGVVNTFQGSTVNDGLGSTNPNFSTLATWATGEAALGYLPHGAGDIVWLTDFNTFDNGCIGQLDNNIFWTNLFAVRAGPTCPWDCADVDGQVGIVDFLALLADWGGRGACDFDGGGVGITDFQALLANWGPCP